MNLRRFHIDKFPQDRIYILLKKEFHKKLFMDIDSKYSFEKLNKVFQGRLKKSTYEYYKHSIKKYGGKVTRKSIPLWFLVKISEIFPTKYSMMKIEDNIFAYKGPSSSSIIWRPNLPLVENGKLLKILAHFLGDGHIGGGFGTKLPKGASSCDYRNFNKWLLDQFESDLQILGKVHTSKDYNHGHVIVPNVVRYILEHIFNIKTGTFDSRVPYKLRKVPKKIIAQFIRAFFDDESHVHDSSIEVYSHNKLLIVDILNLLRYKFPKIKLSNLKLNKKSGKNIKYSFSILSESLEDYLRIINFDHPQKKADLIFNIKRQKLKRINNRLKNPKRLIKTLLKKGNLTTKQLSRKLFLRQDAVSYHLKKMREVKIIGKGNHNERIWALSN